MFEPNSRRDFLRLTGAAAGSTLVRQAFGEGESSGRFYFAVIADTHIIDSFYKGPESSTIDTQSLLQSAARLTAARDFLNGLRPAMEKVFVVGDYFHNYPSPDYDFYFRNKTRLDRAREITDGFRMPCHVGFGNHDYDVPRVTRDFSHSLFREKFGVKPYYSLDYKGWKFIHINNFLGDTWKPGSSAYNQGTGSLGETQLNWLEAELQQAKPSFLFVHYPLMLQAPTEIADYGLHPLLKKHRATIQRVVSGHWHKWYDFARTFGPPHYVMAATRYDANAYMLVEADTKAVSHRVLNLEMVDWATHYSRPYQAG